jgi:cbb3-type cytochrome oxidase subunit 3
MIEINTLRILATLFFFILFVWILIYAIRNRKSKDFVRAAEMPLRD